MQTHSQWAHCHCCLSYSFNTSVVAACLPGSESSATRERFTSLLLGGWLDGYTLPDTSMRQMFSQAPSGCVCMCVHGGNQQIHATLLTTGSDISKPLTAKETRDSSSFEHRPFSSQKCPTLLPIRMEQSVFSCNPLQNYQLMWLIIVCK